MPLAFDLTSTLARGSILPVATTDFARSSRFTSVIFSGSTEAFGFIVNIARTPAATIRTMNPETIAQRSLRRLLLLPVDILENSSTFFGDCIDLYDNARGMFG